LGQVGIGEMDETNMEPINPIKMFTQTHNVGSQSQAQTGTKIYETTSYDVFSFVCGNRDLNQNKVNQLAGEIKQNGLLMPIMVNGKYQVIDGQHRLMACKKIKVPVQYFIRENASVETAANVNMAGSNWTQKDWINKYADQGLSDYVILKDWVEKCAAYSIRQGDAIRIAQNTARQSNYSMYSDGVIRMNVSSSKLPKGVEKLYSVGNDVRIGKWQTGDMDLANYLLTVAVSFNEFPFYCKSAFITALIRVCRIPEFKPEELLSQARRNRKLFTHQSTSDDFIDMIDVVYNKRKHQARKLPIKNNPQLEKK
jgi:hypothetical protein